MKKKDLRCCGNCKHMNNVGKTHENNYVCGYEFDVRRYNYIINVNGSCENWKYDNCDQEERWNINI